MTESTLTTENISAVSIPFRASIAVTTVIAPMESHVKNTSAPPATLMTQTLYAASIRIAVIASNVREMRALH